MIPQNPQAIVPIERSASEPGVARRSRPKSLNWRTLDPTAVFGADSLEEEWVTYKKHLGELLDRKGQYVLIKNSAVIAVYPTLGEALEASAERFGEEPALIKQIVEREPLQSSGGLSD